MIPLGALSSFAFVDMTKNGAWLRAASNPRAKRAARFN